MFIQCFHLNGNILAKGNFPPGNCDKKSGSLRKEIPKSTSGNIAQNGGILHNQ
jgi:hypothetical protein